MYSVNVKEAYSGYSRDADRVKKNLVITETGQVITKVSTEIQIPTRYQKKNIAKIDADTSIFGILAIIMEDEYYGVLNIPAMININPTKVLTKKVNGSTYFSFQFDPKTVMIKNINIVQKDTAIEPVLDEFHFQGKIPWYIDYEDLCKVFDGADVYAGSKLASRYELLELAASIVGRNRKDKNKFYRLIVENKDMLLTTPPAFVGLNSVVYLPDTLSKLTGNHLDNAISSALVTRTEESQRIEQLLRS